MPNGYVPEYILTRTLFPRYAGFALKTWDRIPKGNGFMKALKDWWVHFITTMIYLHNQKSTSQTRPDSDLVINKTQTALADKNYK